MASVDPLEENIKFAKATSVTLGDKVVEKKEADFPMLSDPSKQVATAYGVLNARGTANRWTFYIDKTGRDRRDRQDGAARDVSRRHAGQARRNQDRDEVERSRSKRSDRSGRSGCSRFA